jgi:hypothetical protein
MKHDHGSHRVGDHTPAVAEVDIGDYASFEACLQGLRGVTGANLDRTRGVAHLTV